MRTLLVSLSLLAALLLLPFGASAAALPDLDGDWIVGDVDGSDYDLFMSFNGSQGVLLPRQRANQPTPAPQQLTVDLSKAPFYSVMMANGNDPMVQHSRIVLQTPNDALVWIEGHRNLYRMRRLTQQLFAVLQGPWMIGRASPSEPTQVTFETNTATFLSASGETVSTLYQCYSKDRPTIDIVIASPVGDSNMFHLQPLPDGSFIIWEEENEKFRVLYRQGQKPKWLTEDTPVRTQPAPGNR